MEDENVLYILRGLSGVGKRRLAETLADETFSANDFFYDEHGRYYFDKERLQEAHDQCYEDVVAAMMDDVKYIAVVNTFVQEWEFQRYIDVAEEMGYQVYSIVVEKRHKTKRLSREQLTKARTQYRKFDLKLY